MSHCSTAPSGGTASNIISPQCPNWRDWNVPNPSPRTTFRRSPRNSWRERERGRNTDRRDWECPWRWGRGSWDIQHQPSWRSPICWCYDCMSLGMLLIDSWQAMSDLISIRGVPILWKGHSPGDPSNCGGNDTCWEDRSGCLEKCSGSSKGRWLQGWTRVSWVVKGFYDIPFLDSMHCLLGKCILPYDERRCASLSIVHKHIEVPL